MFGIFGSKKKEAKKPIPQVDLGETTNRLGNNINDVKVKLEVTNKELSEALTEMRTARTPIQKQKAKQKATNVLRKKKMYEAHLNTLQGTQFNVESAHIQSQMMKDNLDVMNVLKNTVDVQKGMMQNMNPDELFDVMDDLREAQEDQNELTDAFTRNYDIDVEDCELDAELDELDYQMRVELESGDYSVPNTQTKVATKKEQDEKELNEILK